jgi:hypothetical protein
MLVGQGAVGSSDVRISLQTDAWAKLLIEKGVIHEAEFLQRIAEERATYQALPQSINTLILYGCQ